MAKTLQFRRDTTANLASVTGANGEIFIDTTKKTVVVMDGSTAGGYPLELQGAGTGATGAIGATGVQGASGSTGASGAQGATFPTANISISANSTYYDLQCLFTPDSNRTLYETLPAGTPVIVTDGTHTGIFTYRGTYSEVDMYGSYIVTSQLDYVSGATTTITGMSGTVIVIGPTGSTGATGVAGSRGPTGATGIDGASGAGASYNQSLNTTDDVVFASGLIGEVSIVGDTVSALDTYGMPGGTLVIDGNISIPTINPLAIGSYMFMRLNSSYGLNVLPGQDVISTELSGPLSSAGVKTTGAVVDWSYVDGTWRCMGYAGVSTESSHMATLWYRVS